MSKTPRTDALLNTTYIGDGTHFVELSRQLEAENAEMAELLALIDSHYSGSLDHQPPYVAKARALLAKVSE